MSCGWAFHMINLWQNEQFSSKLKAFPGQTIEPTGTNMQMRVKSTIELKFSNNAQVNAHMHNWGLTAQPQPEPTHHHKTAGGEKMLPRATNAHVSDHIHMWGFREPPPRTLNHYRKTTKSKKMLAHVNFQIHIKQSRIEHTTTTVTKPSSQGKCNWM